MATFALGVVVGFVVACVVLWLIYRAAENHIGGYFGW